ncbi:hypothetical protein HY572_02785 [Candidatus Micrarchaeota archaeon]|nr:hypothetical protein [Candidatus Micrarchaeota archaeon]
MDIRLNSALLILVFASATAFGLTAVQVSEHYVKTGESKVIDEIGVGGTTYSVLKIDGTPSVVLKPADGTFEPVKEKTQLKPILDAYAQKLFDDQDFAQHAATASTNEAIIREVLGDCRIGADTFVESITRRTIRIGKANIGLYYLIERSNGEEGKSDTYKSEYQAIQQINNSFPAYAAAYDQFAEKAGTFNETVAQGNRDAILASVGVLRDSAATLSREYTTVSSAYATLNASGDFSFILKATFYKSGTPHTCDFVANASTALSVIQNTFSNKALRSADQLVDVVFTETVARLEGAQKGAAGALRAEKTTKIEARIANLTAEYSAGGSVNLTAITAKKDALKQELQTVQQSGATESFDAKYAELDALVLAFESASTQFRLAVSAIAAADANVTEAQRKYGESDARVQEMKKELDGLNANLTSSISVLGTSGAAAGQAGFEAVQTQASQLANRAGTLPPKGNDVDFVIIGGVLVLILALGGTLWYFKKMKPNAPQ